jgi:hypothetical protein
MKKRPNGDGFFFNFNFTLVLFGPAQPFSSSSVAWRSRAKDHTQIFLTIFVRLKNFMHNDT